MKNNSIYTAAFVVLVLVLTSIIGYLGGGNHEQAVNPPSPNQPSFEKLTYKGKKMIYTKHAKCRMGCRFIDSEEVMEVIEKGRINHKKSNPNDKRCPTLAIEGWTHDKQEVRIIVADCEDVAKLVTVIDLNNNYQCACK